MPFAQEIEDKESIAKIYFFLGKSHYLSGDQGKSLSNFNKVIPIAEELDLQELLVLPYCAIGRVNVYICYFKEAIDYLEKGLNLFPPASELDAVTTLEKIYSLGVLIQAYGYIGYKEKTLEAIEKIQNEFKDIKNEVQQLYIQFYVASGYTMGGKPELGLEHANKAMENAKEMKNFLIEVFSVYLLGSAHQRLGNYTDAIRFISKAYNMAKEHNITFGLNMMSFYNAEGYAMLGNTRIAKESLIEAEKYADKNNPLFVEQFKSRVLCICEIVSHSPDFSKAHELIDTAIEKTKEMGDEYNYHVAHNMLIKAGVFFKEDNIAEGDELLEQVKKIYRDIGMEHDIKNADRIKAKFTGKGQISSGLEKASASVSDTTHTQTTFTQTEFTYQRQLQYLLKLAEKLAKIHEMGPLLETIMSLAIEVSGAERGIVFLYDDEDKNAELEIVARKSIDEREEEKEIAYSTVIVHKTLDTKKGQLILDAQEELQGDITVVNNNMKSIITVPLITSNKLLGVIYLDNRQVKGLFTEENFELLKAFAIEASISIENAKLYEQVQETARMEQEMEIAKDIQTSILPTVKDTDSYAMSAFMRTATEVGGDYYDFHMSETPYFGVFGDVSGHGLKSGLVMMMAEVAFNTLMTDEATKQQSLEVLYQKINSTLFNNIQRRLAKKSNIGAQYNHMYMTFRMFRFDDGGNFEMFGNDHAMPFICRAETGEIQAIDSTGFLLGIIPDVKLQNTGFKFTLNKHDILILYSDGITEARGKNSDENERNMYGDERLYDVVSKHRDKTPDEIIKAIVSSVDDWMIEQDDDITLAVLKKK